MVALALHERPRVPMPWAGSGLRGAAKPSTPAQEQLCWSPKPSPGDTREVGGLRARACQTPRPGPRGPVLAGDPPGDAQLPGTLPGVQWRPQAPVEVPVEPGRRWGGGVPLNGSPHLGASPASESPAPNPPRATLTSTLWKQLLLEGLSISLFLQEINTPHKVNGGFRQGALPPRCQGAGSARL